MSLLSFFNRIKPPKACPRCGEIGHWQRLAEAPIQGGVEHARNPGMLLPNARGGSALGHGVPRGLGGGRRTIYRCDSCGFEEAWDESLRGLLGRLSRGSGAKKQ